jgi:hypothetical protein
MAKKMARQASRNDKNRATKLLLIPISALLVKFVIIANIENHVWIGADGENYLNALQGLLVDGIFSKENLLSYWPAGYPLFMYLLGSLSLSNLLAITAVIQSLLYAAACIFFVKEISKTNLSKYTYWIAWILAINPTLSLSSAVIGYEVIPASIFLLVLTLFIRDFKSNNKKFISVNSALAAALMSFSCFVQPRFLLTAVVLFLVWALYTRPKKVVPIFILTTILITAVLPTSLAFRNSKANGFVAISTNLGVTMNLGAGPGATGKYNPEGKYGVPCDSIEGNTAEKDSHLVRCVVKWTLTNPTESIPQIWTKAVAFWSPWIGPDASGSMARNPWLKVHPLKSISANSFEGNKLVYGSIGTLFSWLWMLGTLALMLLGSKALWFAGGLSKKISTLTFLIVFLNWAISVGTLGDHRQRVPIMTVSLFLQIIGLLSLFGKKWRIEPEVQIKENERK